MATMRVPIIQITSNPIETRRTGAVLAPIEARPDRYEQQTYRHHDAPPRRYQAGDGPADDQNRHQSQAPGGHQGVEDLSRARLTHNKSCRLSNPAIPLAQRLDRLVGVQPTRVGHHPQSSITDRLWLLSEDRPGSFECGAVRGEPRNGSYNRLHLGHDGRQALRALTQLGSAQLRRPNRRSADEICDPDPPPLQSLLLLRAHPRRCVYRPVD